MEVMKKAYSEKEVKNILNPIVKKWFFSRFKSFSLPQLYGVMEIHKRNNILVSAPTGATKTLTAFLSILNELVDSAEKGILEDRIYCVYVSPLKALNNDISKNLIEPLQEIEEIAGKKLGIRVAVRTGDTTPNEKQKMLKHPPHILITTPESLGIVLSSYKFIEHLRNVQWCIIDEVHALAENKRGVHLGLSVERLDALSSHMTRIGLSATVSPIEEIAKFLVGYENGELRPCKIVDVQFIKELDLKVLSPLESFMDVTQDKIQTKMYGLIDKLIQEHKTTLIFTNTRAATERVVDHLKDKFPKKYTENIGAHHGSLSKEHRKRLEQRLRDGELKCVVCLDGNTKILDSKGKWVKIKEIEKTYVQSINNKLKINNNRIKNIFKIKNNEKLLKLKTEFGKEIICTRDHKLLTINRNGNLIWKTANELNESEFVATLRNYNFKKLEKEELDIHIFENYPDKYFLFLNSEFLNSIKSIINKKFDTLKKFWQINLKEDIGYSQFIHVLLGEYGMKVKILRKIIGILDIKRRMAFNSINAVSSEKYKMPKPLINKDMMRLIGFMLAEGYITQRDLFISNKNKELISYYRDIIEKISGKSPWMKIGSTGTPILGWSSMFLGGFLKNLGFRHGRKSRISNIPNFVFRLDSDLVFSFLSGYLDGDGYLEVKAGKRVYAAGFSTTSREMAEDISRLLLREKILSSIRSKYCDGIQILKTGREIVKKGWFYDVVVLGGDNLRKFAEKIKPARENLKRIKEVLALTGYTNRDVIPNVGGIIRKLRKFINVSTYKLQKLGLNPIKYELGKRSIGRKQLAKLLSLYNSKDDLLSNLSNSDLFWERIKSKEEVQAPEFVYNIEVENDHNYIANGYLTKNCSTSLELGIDIGYIDLVICLGSPKSVARFLQRAGRAGHRLHEKVKGRIIVLDRDDLIECAVLLKSAVEKKIDRIHIPTNCLDVLAQQIFGIAIQNRIHIDDLWKMIKQSYCYHKLDRSDFMEIIDFLSGEFTSLEDRHVYARIWYDKETGMIGKRGRLARVIYMTNIGTIPDETFIMVKIGNDTIGTLDEAFLEKLKPGDIFVLGGSTYQFKYSRGMVAQVTASSNRPPTVPSWFSEMLPLSFDLANDIGKFRKLMNEKFCLGKPKEEILKFIDDYLYVDKNAANSIYEYFWEQYNFSSIPSNTMIIIEHTKDDRGNVVIFHTLFGRRVNDCLSRAIAYAVSHTQHKDVEVGINDNGFYIRSQGKADVMKAYRLLKSSELRDVMERAIDKTEVYKRRFRHCATRALMILRNYMGRKKRVGRQQVSSMILISALKRINPDFSILKEAKREVLEDLMDVENTKLILEGIEKKNIKINKIHTSMPSPFAFNLALQGYTDMLKMDDKLEFLKRMHNNILAKISLGKK